MSPMLRCVHPRVRLAKAPTSRGWQASGWTPSCGYGVAFLVATDERIRSLVQVRWHRQVGRCVPLSTGTWQLTSGDDEFLITLAPLERRHQLLIGLNIAEHLAALGFPVAAPIRGADGGYLAELPDGLLSVVHAVPGRPLDPADPLDQQWWGDLLGMAHRALADFEQAKLGRLSWLNPDAGHLSVARWVRPLVACAVTLATRLTVTDRLTYGGLHGDPAPEAFRIDPDTGRTALVEWRTPATGPLAYDLAAAVGHPGGPAPAREALHPDLAARARGPGQAVRA